jgi:hypothetical protein
MPLANLLPLLKSEHLWMHNVFYTPSNITSLFQPTDREVIEAFKAYCLRQTFMELFLTGQAQL